MLNHFAAYVSLCLVCCLPSRRLESFAGLVHPPSIALSAALFCHPTRPRSAGWQHSSTSTFGSLHLQQQPEAAVAAATAAASPDIDPWSSGLELVAAAPPAVEPATAPLALTDAGLEALLAPFEDWPYLLQPAGSAVQAMPATLLQAPAACAAAQLPQQQQQQPEQGELYWQRLHAIRAERAYPVVLELPPVQPAVASEQGVAAALSSLLRLLSKRKGE